MKALVLKQDYNNKSTGDIFMIVGDDWSGFLLSNGICESVTIPDGLDNHFLKVVEIAEVPDSWYKEGESDVFVDPEDETWTYVAGTPAYKIIEQDTVSKNAGDVLASLADAKILMDSSIRAFVASKTGSTGDAEMQAQVSSFSLRASNSAEYANEGLTAHVDSASFTQGEALDTAQKVQDFYTEILVEMDKDRQAHIVTYLTTKASLGL